MKTKLLCYICRQKIAEVRLNSTVYFEVAYDFCPTCEGGMIRNFERDMKGLPPLPFDQPKKIRVEGK